MKKITAVAGLLCGLLAGCERSVDVPPEKVLLAYLNAAKAGNWVAAYAHVSSADQAAKGREVYRSEAAPESVLSAAVRKKTSYRVTLVERRAERATVRVEVTSPDLTPIYAGMMGSAFATAFERQGGTDVQELIAERMRAAHLPTRTHDEQFDLVYEDRGWRVFFDWTTKKRVEELLAEGEQRRKEGDLLAALKKYEAALNLDGERIEARKAREEIAREMALLAEKKARRNRKVRPG